MNQVRLSRWLKAAFFGAGVCGALVYGYIFPFWGRDIAAQNPEFAYCYWPWLIFLWATAVPCYGILVCGWKIAREIGKNNSFSRKNARLLHGVARLAGGDAVLFFAGNLVFLLLNMSHPGVALLSLFAVFAGAAVAVFAAALSHLVLKAAEMREENDLTV